MQIMVTITQNNRNPEMLAAVRRDSLFCLFVLALSHAAAARGFEFAWQARTIFATDSAGEDRVFAHPAAEDGDAKGLREACIGARHVVSTTGRRVQARILSATKENAPRHCRRLLGQALGTHFLINFAASI